MKKKGFTLIELLVVIAIIAMLLAILMPALNKVKRLAQRLICTTNLKGMGTAMIVYANDFEDEYPVQGGTALHTWAEQTSGWQAANKDWANPPGNITAGASLFLLVREADVSPKSFVCRSSDEKPYDGKNERNLELVELWDFGIYVPASEWSKSGPRGHVSYSYQIPYDVLGTGSFFFPPDAIGPAGMVLMADRNPWFEPSLDDATAGPDDYLGKINIIDWDHVDKWRNSLVGNSLPHNREGQNALFNDGHAEFEKRPDIGYENDNIYTHLPGSGPWNETNRRQGVAVADRAPGSDFAHSNRDTFLVNDVDVNNP